MSGAGLGEGGSVYPAPAKINRFLHVVGREPDGYHQLQTLFQFLEWGDELRIEAQPGPAIELSGDLCGLAAEDNLIGKAAQRLRSAAKLSAGARIHVRKKIPPGSGLGGGSSNAATTLVVLNRLWGLNWSGERLEQLAQDLGADVPVFIRGQASFAEGRGERMQCVSPPEDQVCLVIPRVHSSTAAVFSAPQMRRDTPRISVDEWPSALEAARNDCELAAFSLRPELARIAAELRRHADFRLSGTGASFFATMASREKVRKIAGCITSSAGDLVVTSTSNVSPLHLSLGIAQAQCRVDGGINETNIGA